MDAFISSQGINYTVQRIYEDQHFKFGDGQTYNSNMNHEMEVEIGQLKTTIKTSVVDVNIPLLLWMDYLKNWGVVIDTGKKGVACKKEQIIISDWCQQVQSLETINSKWENTS